MKLGKIFRFYDHFYYLFKPLLTFDFSSLIWYYLGNTMIEKNAQTEENLKKLKDALEKAKSQFYIFYELTQVMRSTLRLDEIAYIILTCLTARQGLAFNRAILFLVDSPRKTIDGFMGIGPVDSEDANSVWELIEDRKMDLYALIDTYEIAKNYGRLVIGQSVF